MRFTAVNFFGILLVITELTTRSGVHAVNCEVVLDATATGAGFDTLCKNGVNETTVDTMTDTRAKTVNIPKPDESIIGYPV